MRFIKDTLQRLRNIFDEASVEQTVGNTIKNELRVRISNSDIQQPVDVQGWALATEGDRGKPLFGRFTYIKLFAQSLTNAVTIATGESHTDILTYPEPVVADILGSDYLEGTVTATAGNSVSNSINKTFTLAMLNEIETAGLIYVVPSIYLELTQVDATYAGSVSVDSITVDLYEKLVGGTATSIASVTKTVNRSISNTATANETFSELVLVEIPFTSIKKFNKDTLFQVKITVNFTATADAAATTDTIGTVRLNFARGSDETHVYLPVV